MPSTTGLPPQLQRRTCSRNRFSSFSTLLILPSRFRSRPLSSSRGCFRRFSFAPTFFCLLSLAFPRSPALSFPNFSLFYISNASFSPSFANVLPGSRDFFTRVSPSSALTFVLSLSRWFFYNLSRLYFCTHSFSSIDTFSPYCHFRGRCA